MITREDFIQGKEFNKSATSSNIFPFRYNKDTKIVTQRVGSREDFIGIVTDISETGILIGTILLTKYAEVEVKFDELYLI